MRTETRTNSVPCAAQTSFKGSPAHVCRSCRVALSIPFSQATRSASTAAAKAGVDAPAAARLSPSGPEASPTSQPLFTIKAGVVVSRPPLLTPDPHPFETAYHLYQRRLNERLALPFSQYFYYKKNTPAMEQWRTHRQARGGAAARDIGRYNAHSPEAWNDEVLVGDETAQPAKIVEQLVAEEGRSEDFTGSGDPRYAGLMRRTEADEKNDQKSLERSLTRTLYLLVKAKGDGELWKFPAGTLAATEGLKEAAQRILFASCGVNMNTFFVGNHPVGHYQGHAPASDTTMVDGEKIFFMKARILAGQADLSIAQNKNIEDFKWVSKEEVEKLVAPEYWLRVKNMLVAQ
ncbi:uncharacterized protein A1O9_11380 [Exophiala aquamarina CBS 119918]|uniref:Large ribosomal subunit protein mL46 n=1 Tax=Exophiala aquamarina CBS 119918 TaxID=1182545 RepID=A0A072NZU3_9EURO|nr:uncharacterized protein A1O9_11380 [Exophiala aquamarina CBS 119918]KEF52538.1 hypothetical protein A1O9_11380 [Exophiala aquamarina CBS 119918]